MWDNIPSQFTFLTFWNLFIIEFYVNKFQNVREVNCIYVCWALACLVCKFCYVLQFALSICYVLIIMPYYSQLCPFAFNLLCYQILKFNFFKKIIIIYLFQILSVSRLIFTYSNNKVPEQSKHNDNMSSEPSSKKLKIF